MSFDKVLSYPFSNGNLNKILQIGLVFGIIAALEVVLNGGEVAGIGTLVGGLGGIVFGLFVSGYGIFVIQSVLRGEQTLPEFNISQSIGNGFKIFLASLVYFIPVIILMVVVMVMIFASAGPAIEQAFDEIMYSIEYAGYEPELSASASESLMMLPLLLCGSMLFFIPLTFVLGYAAQIGMVRFAVEDRSGALYEYSKNIGMVFKKFGKVIKLFAMQLVVGLLYMMMVGFLGAILGGVLGLTFGTSAMFTIILGVVINVFSGFFNTAQQITNLHLLADFAVEANFVEGKVKNDDSFDEAYQF